MNDSDSTGRYCLGPVGNVVMNVGGRNHGALAVELGPIQPFLDLPLAVGQPSLYSGARLENPPCLADMDLVLLQIDDPKLIHVSRIEGDGKSNLQHSYRLHIPPGHRFLLQVAETDITDYGEYETPQPAKTLSMNSWRNGADVILNLTVQYDDGVPHLKIATESEQLFDYVISAWKQGLGCTTLDTCLQTRRRRSVLMRRFDSCGRGT